MSRIYEALRRAESERAGLTIAHGGEPGPQAGEDELAAPGRKPTIAEQSESPATGFMPDEPRSPAFPPLDLKGVAVRQWTPSMERLPALFERGRTVEQFRSLRSRMQELRDAGPLKSVLVSSGLPQEGKSFVAANLAISLARYKTSRVLLIDGDMRRCSLHSLLGCPNEPPGLTEYLAGKISPEQIMQRRSPEGVPAGQDLPSLTFIGAGTASDKASDLSGNHRFHELMAAVSPHFDWIIVDSSPVNLVADGTNLARACDGVLLIARGGVTKFAAAQRAVAAYKSARILGFVLNAAVDAAAVGEYYEYQGYNPPVPA